MPDDRPVAPKFCKDCRWVASRRPNFSDAHCQHERAQRLTKPNEYLVSGIKQDEENYYCSTMRDPVGFCGPEGKLWEKRDEPS